MHSFFRVSIAFTALVATGGCVMHRSSASPTSSIPAVKGSTRTAFALRYIDVTIGTGAALAARQCVYAHYTGWLTNGTKFDSSRDAMPNGRPKNPLAFPLGVRRVIAGWDVGFDGMKIGGQRRLFIPYQLAYGEAGRLPVIPPKAELIFDVELLAIADTLPHAAATSPAAPARADSTTRRPATPPQPQCPTWATVSGGR
jgi:peptidylprolyl isomerase